VNVLPKTIADFIATVARTWMSARSRCAERELRFFTSYASLVADLRARQSAGDPDKTAGNTLGLRR